MENEVVIRAWDGEKMIQPYVTLSNQGIAVTETIPVDEVKISIKTGFKDSLGTDIYGGDLLSDFDDQNLLVQWDKDLGAWSVVNAEDPKNSYGLLSAELNYRPQVLFGNIYSNKI